MIKKLSPADIENLIQSVRKAEEQVDNAFATIVQNGINIEEKVIAFLLGFSGTGKTTLYYALTGKELKVVKERRKLRLESVTPESNFPIMNDQCSYLNSPILNYNSDNDIIFCDCPCFSDDRGEVQEIINSFSISRALSRAKKLKVLLLTTENDIESSKGKPVRDSCELISNTFHNQQYLESTIALVISKVNPEYSDSLFLEDFETCTDPLLEMLKQRESGNDKRVFIFPSPSREMVDNDYTGFASKDEILEFIRNCQICNLQPRISLSPQAKLFLSRNIDALGDLSQILQLFIEQIQFDYSLADDELDLWKDRIEQLCNCQMSTPKDFVDQCRQILPPGSKYEQIYNDVMRIDNWRSFLERICPEDESSNDRFLSRHNQAMQAVFLDISQFLSQRLRPSLEILTNKIEMVKQNEEDNAEIQSLRNEIQNQEERTRELMKEINDLQNDGDEIEKKLALMEEDQPESQKDKQQNPQPNQQNRPEAKNRQTKTCLLL